MIDKIDLSRVIKAKDTFERFRLNLTNEQYKAGAVQAYEFCYELAWKIMKRFLNQRGIEVNSPKETFRQAALEKIIDDPEIWFEFQKKRNLTVHTYEEENLDLIISIFDIFSKELNQLIIKLESL